MRALKDSPMTHRSLLAAALFGLAALSGCRIEKPSTVVPAPPSIERFTTSAATSKVGEQVTLSWKTSQATAIELREASTGALNVAADAFEGSLEVTIAANSLFVLTARGPGGTDARALSVTLPGAQVSEVTFQALPPSIVGGQSTTLVWSAPGAPSVALTAGSQAVDVSGQRSSGAVTVFPLFDTTYTLVAGTVTRTAMVAVQPAVLSMTAEPRAVEPGEMVTITWTAAGAERLVLSSPGRGQLAEITDPARIVSGTFTDVAPTLPNGGLITYELSAVKGASSRTQRVEINVGRELSIVRFDAPPVASPGLNYQVRWQTLGADRVELKLDGISVHQTGSRADAVTGLFSLTAPLTDFSVELIATNARGERLTRVLQVDVVGVPTAATLTANPTTVTAGQPVTLTFASLEARRVRIVDLSGETVFSVTGQLAEGGTATVYPSADTTYTLSADNLLGNAAVTATAQVTVTGTPLTVTQFPPTAVSGQNVNLLADQPGALFYGFPHGQVLRSNQADFLDIRSTGARVLESSDITQVDLPFATWLWGTQQSGPLTISRAGWMAWGAPLVVNATETSLPSTGTTAAPGLIAPYWDSLTLTGPNSAVFAQLVGNAPDQSLVVQWDGLEVASSDSTEVTFQVRVHQNGVVSFHYKTMTLNASPTFTIGVQDNTRKLALQATGAPVSNSAIYFFSPVSSVSTRVAKGTRWGGVVQVGNARTRVSQPAVAVNVPGDLAVSEFMFRPSPSVANGQYLELYNRTTTALDMTGWELRSTSSSTPFSVGNGFSLAPGLTLIGGSTDPLENDDAGVTVTWGSFFVSADAGTLTFANPDAGLTLPYAGPSDGGTGASLELDFNTYLESTNAPNLTCTAGPLRTFGSQTPLQQGTPGSLGACFGYAAPVAIPSRYVDISATGTALLNSPSDTVDGQTVAITLAATASDPAPFAFRARRPVISMSTDGWLVWGSSTEVNYTNKTTLSSTTPVGVIAPFWDDLQTVIGSPCDMYWKRFAANEDPVTTAPHWVFMWHHFRHFVTSPADDLNFEVKIFEDGTIEYHYGTMTSGTSSNFANGNSATVWLEEPTGNRAFPLSINQAVVAPNTAWRFVTQ